jgi:hypothetical protein
MRFRCAAIGTIHDGIFHACPSSACWLRNAIGMHFDGLASNGSFKLA